MEIVVAFIIIIGIYLAYLWIRFSSFKSEVMNELGQRGISYTAADALYTLWSNEIHRMHHDNMPAAQIADIITDNVDMSEPTPIPASMLETEIYTTFDEWYVAFLDQCSRLDPEKAKWLQFLDQDPLKLGFQHGKDPKELAQEWVQAFDPNDMLNGLR